MKPNNLISLSLSLVLTRGDRQTAILSVYLRRQTDRQTEDTFRIRFAHRGSGRCLLAEGATLRSAPKRPHGRRPPPPPLPRHISIERNARTSRTTLRIVSWSMYNYPSPNDQRVAALTRTQAENGRTPGRLRASSPRRYGRARWARCCSSRGSAALTRRRIARSPSRPAGGC